MKKKVLISIFSLFFFLLLVEGALRVAGYLYLLSRGHTPPEGFYSTIRDQGRQRGEGDYVILAVGDSYTFGGNVPSEQTYPPRLQDLLSQKYPQKKFSVINAGVCEYNSRQVLIRLPGWIEKYQPDIILFLAGATDKFNFAGYSFQDRGVKALLANLRIYKMFKIIRLNLQARSLARTARSGIHSSVAYGFYHEKEGDTIQNYFGQMKQIGIYSNQESPLEKAWYYYQHGQSEKAIRIAEKALKDKPGSVELLCDLAHFYYYVPEDIRHSPPHRHLDEEKVQKAKQLYLEAKAISPDSDFVSAHMAHFYRVLGEDYLARHKHDLAIDFLLRSIEIDPIFDHPYYLIARTQKLQSKYEARYLADRFKKIAKNKPELKENELFMNNLIFFKDKGKWEEEINLKIKKNLEKIIKLCQEHNIKLVIQNYPYPYVAANRILENVALEHSLPFVDNREVFRQLTADKDLQEYFHFYTDEHCSPEGYQVMAQNIFRLLAEGDFLRTKK